MPRRDIRWRSAPPRHNNAILFVLAGTAATSQWRALPVRADRLAGRARVAALSGKLQACAAALSVGAALLATVPREAAAHGQLPAVLGLVAADAQGPTIARLTAGFAVRDAKDAKKYQYVCSPRWVSPRSPQIAAVASGSAWIAGEEGFYRLDANGKVTRVAVAGVDPLTVRAIGAAGSDALALTVVKGAAKVHALARPAVQGAAPVLWTGTGEWYGARNSADAMWIAQSGGATVRIVGVRGDGAHSDEQVAIDSATATASVVWATPTADKVYLSLVGKATQRIVEVDRSAPASGPRAAKLLLQEYPFVAGPVPVAGKALAVVTGVLMDLSTNPAGQVDDSRWYTCIDGARRADGSVFVAACAKSELYAIDAAGKPGPLAFALYQLTPPDYSGLDDLNKTGCWAEWSDFARDSGIDAGPEPAGAAAHADHGGCSAGRVENLASHASALIWALAGLLLLALRRRPTPQDRASGGL